jgi:hypothetical protein
MKFEWDLLENALDFIYVALERLSQDKLSKQDLKYGLLHLSSGVELLFKEALRREHWSLIFRDPDQATVEALNSGDFKSVDFESCLKRLQNIASVRKLSKSQQTELLGFRQKRNQLEHFGITGPPDAVIASSAHLMSTVVDFMKDQLEPNKWDQACKDCYERITRKLYEFKEFVAHRNDEIMPLLEQARMNSTVVICGSCFEVTLLLRNSSQPNCLFCRYEASAADAAEFWVRTILGTFRYETEKEGGQYPVHECPECDEGTLVDTNNVLESFNLERYICFSCGGVFKGSSMRHCGTCGRLYQFRQNDELGMCVTCFQDLQRKRDKH